MTKLKYLFNLVNKMYIPRILKKAFHESIKLFPAVLITGPRQSGKTTFLRNETKNVPYITFYDHLNRDFALRDPNGFLDQFKGKTVVLDEIQYAPELVAAIKRRVDKDL